MGDKILSPEEIDALLKNAGGEVPDPGDASGDDSPADDDYSFNPMDLGTLGEIYNISMGSAANAVSSLLRMKVDITAPSVEMLTGEDLIFQSLEPAVGVEIKYVAGVEGINVFILSQIDVMKIVDIWMGGTGVVDESSEFTDMHMSAIGELMNQMMGASSMALAGVLSTPIDISSPVTYKIEGDFSPENNRAMQGKIVAVRFKFIVGNIINSEMITTCTLDFARSMIDMAMNSFGKADGSNERVQEIIAENSASEVNKARQSKSGGGTAQNNQNNQSSKNAQNSQNSQSNQSNQNNQNNNGGQQQNQYNPAQSQNAQNTQNTASLFSQPPQNAQFANWGSLDSNNDYSGAYPGNLRLIKGVPIDVTVEIGRAKRTVQDVLDLGEGSIVELNKQASDPVDLYVNGTLVARGIVVVIEENFGVRITEIVSNDEIEQAVNKK